MLAQIARRLSLTGLLMASLVGTGLLFGSAGPIRPLEANVAETSANVAEMAAAVSESAPASTAPAGPGAAAGADLRWPFFTFGRKRSGPSW
jgi:hypothetical protein